MTVFRHASRDQSIPAAPVGPPQSPSISADAPLSGRVPFLRGRLTGPGGYYNLGNAIGLASGVIQQLAAALGGQRAEVSALGAVQDYFFGSPAATALTIAMVIFFLSGELYFRGWRLGHQPDLHLIRLGDLSSGVAALVLLVALAIIGSAWLAAASTVLLAAGKFGSAMRPGAQWRVRLGSGRTFDPLRLAVIFSRLLAMLAIILATVSLAKSSSLSLSQSAPQIVLLLCYGLWLRADVLLNSLQDP